MYCFFKNKNYTSKNFFQDLKSKSSNINTVKSFGKVIPTIKPIKHKNTRSNYHILFFKNDGNKKKPKTNFIYDSNILMESPYSRLIKPSFSNNLQEKSDNKVKNIFKRSVILPNTSNDIKDIYR